MKNLVIIIVILAILGAGGYFYMNYQKAGGKLPVTQPAAGNAGQGNVFTSIKDALSKSLSLRCDYPDPVTKTTVTSYIKNGAVRVGNFTMTAQNKGNAIMKDNKMWVWNEGDKQGMIITLNAGQTAAEKAQASKDQQQEILDSLEKNKQYCKTEVVSDSLFIPPADVKFMDLSEGLKNIPTIVLSPSE